MKMRKLFAGLLATSIVAAGASVFAAEIPNDAGFDKVAGTYSIASNLSEYGTEQMTILIIPEAAYLAGTINDADILYIDQAAANTENIFKNVGILGGTTLDDGTYYVKIGGETLSDKGIIVEKFTKTTTPVGPTYTLGDINGKDGVNILDANLALQYCAELVSFDETQTLAADVNGKDSVNILDANLILQYCAELITSFPAAK